MGDIKCTINKTEIEPETPKNNEDNSHDRSSRAKRLRSMANNVKKKRTTDPSESISSPMSTKDENLLAVCKPISIKLMRLPHAVVNKFTQAAEERAKKRRKAMWKIGICGTAKTRKFIKQNKLRQEKSMLLKWLQSGANVKSEKDVEKPKLQEIVISEISKISESATIEDAPSGKSELPTQSIAAEENVIYKNAECNEKTEITAETQTRSELSENEPETAPETFEISLNNTDQKSCPEISDNTEIRVATKIPRELSNAAVDSTKTLSASSPVVPSETTNNQNRRISLTRLFEQNNSITPQFVKTRKRTLQSDHKTDGIQNDLSKKYKSASGSNSSEQIDTIPEKNNSESIKSNVPIQKLTVTKPNRANPKSVRRRSIQMEKMVLREVKVILCRLEDSQDSSVLKWTRNNTLARSNDIILTESKTSPIKNRAVEESSKVGTVVAGVPITSLEDPSETLDILRRLNGPVKLGTDVLSKERSSVELEAATAVPITCEQTSNSQDEEDDDEIVQFLHRHRKVRPSIDSSSSAGSSTSQSFVSTRVLRSKTPIINGSSLEKLVESPVAITTPRSRICVRSTSTESSNHETLNNDKETSEPLRQQPIKTLSLRRTETRASTTSGSSDCPGTRQEPRRLPSSRRKASQVARDDKTVNDDEQSRVLLSEEKTTVSPTVNDSAERENVPNVQENEAGMIKENNNSSVNRNSNFVTCGQNQEDELSLDSVTKVNCHFSEIEIANSDSCNEVLAARRKLTALKNAMVVLTRLENLDGNAIEFNATEDFQFSRSSTPDPLAINRNENQDSLSETENSIVPFNGAVRVGLRKTLRSDRAAITDIQNIQESPESDVEMHLTFEDAYSQETIESDVEMTLIFEENSSPESKDSDAEFPKIPDTDRRRSASRDADESPDLVVLDGGKAGQSQDDEQASSLGSSSIHPTQSFPEGILADATSNSDNSRKLPDDYEGLDEHCKRCSCEEHKSDKHRLNCQNIRGSYKCVRCRVIFKDAKTLTEHKSTNPVCSSGFNCNICETTFSTQNELTIHRLSCVEKSSQKKSSLDEPTNTEETAEAENEEKSVIKGKQKSGSFQRALSKRLKAKNREPIEDLKCGVCSITFETSQALSEHIFKHNTVELQQAYKNAKAKAMGDNKTSKDVLAKQKDKISDDESALQIVSVQTPKDKSLPQKSSAVIPPPIATTVATTDTNANSAIVCLCHRDNHPACPDKTDLQIEMVLLCQYCMVIFRRRECFEVHYRNSPQCATDRTRGRSPKLYCANCQSTLNSWAGMRRHLEVHASLNVEGTVRFVCNICRVIFVGFGALFYNHWSNHMKDTMFVASRYSFPKNSVQPIDGIPKLPIGATSNENYILVAEHVCTNCKKPFSTRRDLEIHVKSKSCVETDESTTPEKQWYCDVCNSSFRSRRNFNMHSQMQHDHRFLCVATMPSTPAFMCTRCFAMRKLVADIEEHWKTAMQHDTPLGSSEKQALTEKTLLTDQASNYSNGSTNVNETARTLTLENSAVETEAINSREKSKNKDVELLIDISESIEQEITCVFQSPTKTAGNSEVSVNNQESQSPLTNSSGTCVKAANNLSMLRDLLGPSPALDNDERAKTRVFEEPCLNVVLPDVSKANESAKLVISDVRTKSADESRGQANIVSCKKVMTPNASSENVQVENNATQTTLSAKKANKESSTANTSNEKIVTASKPKLSDKEDSLSESSVNLGVSAKTPDKADGIKNLTESKKPETAVSIWLKQTLAEIRLPKWKKQLPASVSTEPEIIDLSDEKEEVKEPPTATPVHKSKPTSVITKNGKTIASKKPGSAKSKKSAAKSKTTGNSVASNSGGFPFVLDTAEKSFEEVRFADYTKSKELALKDTAGAKKPGFLRVKNLSELQAVKIHNCLNCNTVFETSTALEEHYQSRLCTSLEKQAECPKGMTTAIIVPNNSNETSTQSLPTVYAAGSVVTQQLIGLDPGLGVISGVSVPSVIVNNENPTGSWITVGGQHDSISSVALVNTTHSLSGGTLLMNLGGQQTANGNTNAIMTKSIGTSTATIAQSQGILQQQQYQQQQLQPYQQQQQQQQQQYQQQQQQPYQQQQQQQPYQQQQQQQPHQQQQQQQYQQQQQQQQYQQQQQQPYQQQQQQPYQQQQQPYQQQSLLGMNQQLSDNCNGQLGFHVMPAMVLPQSSHISKQQCTDGALRNTSIANLPINGHINGAPFTYHSSRPNRYICSICSTYSCNSIGTMNVHVMKHYTGFNNTTSQNTSQSAQISNVGFQSAKDKSSQNVALRSKTQESNSIGTSMKDSVFLKNTPQGLVWVTSVSTQMANQEPGSSAGPNNGPISGGDNAVRGGQVVYRCLICKCAMYKTYPPLRNHVVLVHGITDLISAGLDNFVQKIYLCTHCPHGAAMYDSEESHRQHVDSCHSIVCMNCGRAFATHNNLKIHMISCPGVNRDTNNTSDKNC